jgi:hypothetical protein
MTEDDGCLFPARGPDPPGQLLLAAPDCPGVGDYLEHVGTVSSWPVIVSSLLSRCF